MREPVCPNFGKCGGCATQHLPYELQLKNKLLRASSALKTHDIEVFSGDEFHYRNRMDLIFTQQGIGFRKKGCWAERVDVTDCAISNPHLNTLITEVRAHFGGVDPYDPVAQTGTYRYAVIRTPQNDSSISFVLNRDSTRCGPAAERIRSFANTCSANHVLITYVPSNTDVSISTDYLVVKGKDTLEETLLTKKFHYSVQGFFQNNHAMAESLHEYVNRELAKRVTPGAHLLDLYGGIGSFGIINSSLFSSVTTVESFEGSTQSARENICANGCENVEAVLLDAKQLGRLRLRAPLFVVTDPPRSGMHPKAIKSLLDLQPECIIYISCNLVQLSKELPRFLKGYHLEKAAIFDLFPQTNHMETVVVLTRKV